MNLCPKCVLLWEETICAVCEGETVECPEREEIMYDSGDVTLDFLRRFFSCDTSE